MKSKTRNRLGIAWIDNRQVGRAWTRCLLRRTSHCILSIWFCSLLVQWGLLSGSHKCYGRMVDKRVLWIFWSKKRTQSLIWDAFVYLKKEILNIFYFFLNKLNTVQPNNLQELISTYMSTGIINEIRINYEKLTWDKYEIFKSLLFQFFSGCKVGRKSSNYLYPVPSAFFLFCF